jgi:hypothetical protein
MLYFRNIYFYIFNIIKWYKTILFQGVIIIQVLIVLCKRLCRHVTIYAIFAFKHTPKTCGLILEHVWSLFCKLHTCQLTSPEICPSSLYATCIPFTVFPDCHCHCPFCVPACIIEPWCKRFSPFIWVSWCCNLNLFYYTCSNRFLK